MKKRWVALAVGLALSLVATTAGANNHTPAPDPDHGPAVEVGNPEARKFPMPVIVTADGTADIQLPVSWIDDDTHTTAVVTINNMGDYHKLVKTPGVLSVDSSGGMRLTASSTMNSGGKAAVTPMDHTSSTGSGAIVVIVDTSFDLNESLLGGSKVIDEYCTTSNASCPGGTNTATGSGVSSDSWCQSLGSGYPANNCYHGTAMAEMAAGYDSGINDDYWGIAPGAKLVLIRAGEWNSGTSTVDFASASLTDALTWVKTKVDAGAWNSSGKVASVNLSMGAPILVSGVPTWPAGVCNDNTRDLPMMNAIAALHANTREISVVAAAGNDAQSNGMQWPACIKSTFSVTGTTSGALDANANINAFTDVAAPWSQFYIYGGTGHSAGGTSSSTAVISGALAALYEKSGGGLSTKYSWREEALKGVGDEIQDARSACTSAFKCFGLFDTDVAKAVDVQLDYLALTTNDVRMFAEPVRVYDSRDGFGISLVRDNENGGASTSPINSIGDGPVTLNLATGLSTAPQAVVAKVTWYNSTNDATVCVNSTAKCSSSSTAWSNAFVPGGITQPFSTTVLTSTSGGALIIDPVTCGATGACSINAAIDILGVVKTTSDLSLVTAAGSQTLFNSTISGGSSTNVTVASTLGSPAAGTITGVWGVLEATAGASATYLGMGASSGSGNHDLDLAAGQHASNLVFVPATLLAGQVNIYNDAGTATVKFTMLGWFTSGDSDVQLISRGNDVVNTSLAANGGSITSATSCSGNGAFLNTRNFPSSSWAGIEFRPDPSVFGHATPADYGGGQFINNSSTSTFAHNNTTGVRDAHLIVNTGTVSATVHTDEVACFG